MSRSPVTVRSTSAAAARAWRATLASASRRTATRSSTSSAGSVFCAEPLSRISGANPNAVEASAMTSSNWLRRLSWGPPSTRLSWKIVLRI